MTEEEREAGEYSRSVRKGFAAVMGACHSLSRLQGNPNLCGPTSPIKSKGEHPELNAWQTFRKVLTELTSGKSGQVEDVERGEVL